MFQQNQKHNTDCLVNDLTVAPGPVMTRVLINHTISLAMQHTIPQMSYVLQKQIECATWQKTKQAALHVMSNLFELHTFCFCYCHV